MEQVLKLMSSRTNVTAVLIFLVNTTPLLSTVVGNEMMVLINSILSALVIYFRVNTKVDFSK